MYYNTYAPISCMRSHSLAFSSFIRPRRFLVQLGRFLPVGIMNVFGKRPISSGIVPSFWACLYMSCILEIMPDFWSSLADFWACH